jgi:hypothetical protein
VRKVEGLSSVSNHLHPDWWTSWGFGELDEELIKFAKQMKLAKAQDDKMLKVKEAVTSGQYLSPKETSEVRRTEFSNTSSMSVFFYRT